MLCDAEGDLLSTRKANITLYVKPLGRDGTLADAVGKEKDTFLLRLWLLLAFLVKILFFMWTHMG